jgi:Major Facilitator Superfamily
MQFADTHKEGSEHDRQARELGLGPRQFPPTTIDEKEGDDDRREGQLDLISTEDTHRGAVADTTMRRLLGPLRRRPVRRLLAANLVSKTGDWLTVGALMGWMYQETGSTGSVALLMLVRLAPPILGGGAAAALVDGVRKERLLVVVELLRAVALATVLVGLLSGLTAAVYAAIAVSGLLGAISPVAISALIPRLVPAAELPSANGLCGVIESTAMATGAVAGGALLALVGIGPALALDLMTFILAAMLFAAMPTAGHTDAPAVDGAGDGAPAPRLRQLLADRTIVTAVGALCITVAASGLINATLPRFLADLGLGTGAYGYGFGAIAIGLAIGGAVAGAIRVEHADTGVLGRTLLATAVIFCALAVVANAPLALLLLVLVGALDAIGWVMFDTVMQRTADPRLLGKAFGITDAVVRTSMIGSIALSPLANELAAPSRILAIGATVFAIAGLVALAGASRGRSARRSLRLRRLEPSRSSS